MTGMKDINALLNMPTIAVAQALLGCELVSTGPDDKTSGIIVETEAYLSQDDASSHAFRGQTKRNGSMFSRPGTVYVYFTYGKHFCLNIVTGPVGVGEAVLIRAMEPTGGLDLMQKRRQTEQPQLLMRGPACVAQALGLSLADNGTHIEDGRLLLLPRRKTPLIQTGVRIGITKAQDLPLRFWIKGSPFVSGSRKV